jgi:hypothetical protein
MEDETGFDFLLGLRITRIIQIFDKKLNNNPFDPRNPWIIALKDKL